MMQGVAEYTKVESIFIRHRNILLLKAEFTPIFTDHYLHLMKNKVRHNDKLDGILKDLMATLVLHSVARPWREIIAWTVNLRAPRANFFASVSSTHETIIGRLFTDNVKESDRNLLFSQTLDTSSNKPRTSTIQVDTNDPIEWLESYYTQSEQRPAKAFRFDDEYYLFACQPQFDEEWFEALDAETAKQVLEAEQTKLLETRKFKFECGCSLEKILPTLSAWKDKPEELFGGQETIKITCPRCGMEYLVTQEAFEAFNAKEGSEDA